MVISIFLRQKTQLLNACEHIRDENQFKVLCVFWVFVGGKRFWEQVSHFALI